MLPRPVPAEVAVAVWPEARWETPAVPALNTAVVLARRPAGRVTVDCFRLVQGPVPEPGPGEVLVRHLYLSVDPYLRGRMDGAFALDRVVPVRVVGQVAASRHDRWAEGDFVWGFLGWQEWSVLRPSGAAVGIEDRLWPVDPAHGPIAWAISALGMPGLTAWVGTFDLGRPQPGETVFVSAAAGAVGSLVGQFARLAGARAVGSAGSAAKVTHCLDVLNYDDAFDYRSCPDVEALVEVVRATCPRGVDVYFDNVGGPTLEAALRCLSPFGRVPVCGMISRYEEADDPGVKGLINLLAKRATMTGFSIYDHLHRLPDWLPRMADLLRSGRVVYHQETWQGIRCVPDAFVSMLAGGNVGKRVVQVADDPTLPAVSPA
jgi:NADPH-dependent curcumin reductase CurA